MTMATVAPMIMPAIAPSLRPSLSDDGDGVSVGTVHSEVVKTELVELT